MHRTTVELTEGQRASLIALAAKRGERGFSKLVQEAIDRYLAEESSRQDARDKALALRGTFKGRSGVAFADGVRQARASWDR